MNSSLLQALARQRQEEICRKVEFRQRHAPAERASNASSRPCRCAQSWAFSSSEQATDFSWDQALLARRRGTARNR